MSRTGESTGQGAAEVEFLAALADFLDAWNRFNYAETEDVDVAIHELNAAEARLHASRRRVVEERCGGKRS